MYVCMYVCIYYTYLVSYLPMEQIMAYIQISASHQLTTYYISKSTYIDVFHALFKRGNSLHFVSTGLMKELS